jgi:hypothetical protein
MPKRNPRRPGKTVIYIEVPDALFDALEERRRLGRHSRTTEVMIALEKHLGFDAPKQDTLSAARAGA